VPVYVIKYNERASDSVHYNALYESNIETIVRPSQRDALSRDLLRFCAQNIFASTRRPCDSLSNRMICAHIDQAVSETRLINICTFVSIDGRTKIITKYVDFENLSTMSRKKTLPLNVDDRINCTVEFSLFESGGSNLWLWFESKTDTHFLNSCPLKILRYLKRRPHRSTKRSE